VPELNRPMLLKCEEVDLVIAVVTFRVPLNILTGIKSICHETKPQGHLQGRLHMYRGCSAGLEQQVPGYGSCQH
jgi:hypothetical protein